MALIAQAETAQDIAAGLNKFLDPVPDYSTEITALISECFAISSALRELTTAIGDSRFNRQYHEVKEDINITLRSLDYTFDDVRRLFGGLGRANHVSHGAAYRSVWTDITVHFQEESGNSLCRRLEFYRRFLLMLTSVVERSSPDPHEFDDLQYRISDLLQVQDDRLADNVNNLTLGSPGAARVRSFERNRPRGIHPPSPPSPDPAPIPRRRPGPHSPLSPGFDQEFRWNPPAPEVPNSPVTTNTSSTSQSSRASIAISHWVPRMFEQSRPTTGFHNIGQVSVCLGEDSPSASSKLAEEYEKLVEMPFERGDLLVRFYHRPSDQRARVHCRTIRPSRSRKQSCLPLTSLRIQRVASCLQLCQMDRSGRSVAIWANLRFPSYEQMILFHCTFLALKAEDSENHVRGTVDAELHGEKEYFGGLIIDDHYEHALRVFKDRDSGGIRIQASVRGGDLKRTPVWTAFITHLINSRTWMWKDSHSSKTVYLADLQRYIFTEEYTPQLGPDGEHELRFKTSKYAQDFMEALKDLKGS